MTAPEATREDCRSGNDALARGAWDEAQRAFTAALARDESAEALEGLGLAAWWLDQADVVFDSRERAYKLYLDRENRRAAARIAVWLAWDCWAFRGETAVATAGSTRRLLDGLRSRPSSPGSKPAKASSRSPRMAIRIARIGTRQKRSALDAPPVRSTTMLRLSLQGLALVASGAVAEGCASSTK
jgi:hypothetical protein